MQPLIDLADAGDWEGAHHALRQLLAARLAHRARRERGRAGVPGPAVQPRGPLPLLAGGVVHPLAPRHLRRPRVHRRRGIHAARGVRAAAPPRHPARRGGHRHRPARRTASPSTTATASARACRVDRRRVHRDGARSSGWATSRPPGSTSRKAFNLRNVYYGRAHKIFLSFSRRWWVDEGITHGAIDHGPAPSARSSTRRPARTRAASGACSSAPMPGSRTRCRGATCPSTSGSPRRSRTSPRSIRPRGDTFETGYALRLGARPVGGRHRSAVPALRDVAARPTTTWSGRWAGCGSPTTPATGWVVAGSRASLAAAIKNAYAIHTGMRDELPVAPDA